MNKSKPLLGTSWVGVLLLIALWLGCTAWIRPLMLPDEGRYASVAWEMLASGDWLTPTLNGLQDRPSLLPGRARWWAQYWQVFRFSFSHCAGAARRWRGVRCWC